MKKILFPLVAICLSATAFAVPEISNALSQLNLEVKRIIKPHLNIDTQASLKFLDITTDQDRALALKLNAFYRKYGDINHLYVQVDDLS